MAAAHETKGKGLRKEKRLINDLFRTNAGKIIEGVLILNNPPIRVATLLVDEILHSIFFLGNINSPPCSPEEIVNDNDMLEDLKNTFPRPFQYYSCQLPKRSPISCVLDMIIQLTGEKNEQKIIEELQKFQLKLRKTEKKKSTSSTICVSQKNAAEHSVRYYGVSMSTSGCNPGRIVIAASCLSNWDSYVADAVMTYYPLKTKKTYFDGTIKLPEEVRCQAFSLSDGTPMAPCRSCGNLFGLTTSETREWAYGNCAEAESLSNLLKNETEMRERVQQPSDTCTDANRQEAVEDVKKVLKSYLDKKFKQDQLHYYTPQLNSLHIKY